MVKVRLRSTELVRSRKACFNLTYNVPYVRYGNLFLAPTVWEALLHQFTPERGLAAEQATRLTEESAKVLPLIRMHQKFPIIVSKVCRGQIPGFTYKQSLITTSSSTEQVSKSTPYHMITTSHKKSL